MPEHTSNMFWYTQTACTAAAFLLEAQTQHAVNNVGNMHSLSKQTQT
jgi:hypothetical protein